MRTETIQEKPVIRYAATLEALFSCIEETLDAYRNRGLSAENALAEILYAIKRMVTHNEA